MDMTLGELRELVMDSEALDEWTLVDDVDMDPVAVSHWMRLPELPEGVEE